MSPQQLSIGEGTRNKNKPAGASPLWAQACFFALPSAAFSSFLPSASALSVLHCIHGEGGKRGMEHALEPPPRLLGLWVPTSAFGQELNCPFGPELGAHRMHLRPPARADLGGRGEWVLIQGQLSPQPFAGGVSRAVRVGFVCMSGGKRGMEHALEQLAIFPTQPSGGVRPIRRSPGTCQRPTTCVHAG